MQRWIIKLSGRFSTKRVKGRILFPIPFPVASPEMEKREEREVPGIHEGRKALWEEGILLAKNGMPSISNKMADSRNALLSGRPYTDPNARADHTQTQKHRADGGTERGSSQLTSWEPEADETSFPECPSQVPRQEFLSRGMSSVLLQW